MDTTENMKQDVSKSESDVNSEIDKTPKCMKSQSRQWMACLSATLSMVAAGCVYGWSTTMLSRLIHDNDVPVKIDNPQSSWIVSLTVIGSMIGSFMGAWIADGFGRKICLLSTSLFYSSGWIIVLFAKNVEALYVSRIILGIGVGISFVANPLYVSEVADTNIRGALCTLIAINIFTGSLITCSIGPWLSYYELSYVLLAIVLLFILTFSWFPETPYYLVSKSKNSDAIKSIQFFTGFNNRDLVLRELEKVTDEVKKKDFDHGLYESDRHVSWLNKLKMLLTIRSNRRALIITVGLVGLVELSGNYSTIQYLETLFRESKMGVNSNLLTCIVIAVGLVSGFLTTLTIDYFGRRPLLLVSSLGSSIALGVFGTLLLIKKQEIIFNSINVLIVAAVILAQIFYQVGIGTVPNLLTGEMFPTNVKGCASAILTITDGILGFVVSKLFQVFSDLFGYEFVYFVFSISCFIGFILIFIFLPETRKQSFKRIQEILASNKFAWKLNSNNQLHSTS